MVPSTFNHFIYHDQYGNMQNMQKTVKNEKWLLLKGVNHAGLFFAQFFGGNLRHFASITLSFFQILEFFGKCLEFF